MEKERVVRNIRERKCIAIVRGVDSEDCVSLARALYDGGINMMEITFDQTAKDGWRNTLHGIQSVCEALPGRMYVGAGTVMSEEQLLLAVNAGAEYIIFPHTDEALIRRTVSLGLTAIPGAFTPTEAVRAYEAGASFVKLFPAGSLGTGYMKAMTGPLKHIPFLAVGDIHEHNIAEFLQAGACGAGIGGNLINKEWIQQKEYGKITELAKIYRKRIGLPWKAADGS